MPNNASNAVLAIDAGGTFFKTALIDEAGEILPGSFDQVASCSDGNASEIMAAYESILRKGFAHARDLNKTICGIGISTPGPFDYVSGRSLMKHKYRAIMGIPLREKFHSMHIIPNDMPIHFLHDAHAFLMGEQWNGAIKNIANAAAITIGTGLGFGMMKNGIICENDQGGPAISLFHLPYNNGILEDVVSRRGIIHRYKQYQGLDNIDLDVHDISELAENDNAAALKAFQETGEILAEEMCEILVSNEIESVVFGGQISKSFDLFESAFMDILSEKANQITALPADDIDYSSLKGVAHNALSNIMFDKNTFDIELENVRTFPGEKCESPRE
jgi:glucokinase